MLGKTSVARGLNNSLIIMSVLTTELSIMNFLQFHSSPGQLAVRILPAMREIFDTHCTFAYSPLFITSFLSFRVLGTFQRYPQKVPLSFWHILSAYVKSQVSDFCLPHKLWDPQRSGFSHTREIFRDQTITSPSSSVA